MPEPAAPASREAELIAELAELAPAELRARAIAALRRLAVLDPDAGGRGVAEGVAERLERNPAERVGPRYVAGVELAVDRYARERLASAAAGYERAARDLGDAVVRACRAIERLEALAREAEALAEEAARHG